MNKECRLFFAVALTAAVCACRCYGDAEDTLKELREKPSDVSLLIKLKGDIGGIKDTDEKCRLGVIYCLGTIAFGNANEGLTVKDGMAKAFKSCLMLNELSDEKIYDDCVQCEGGKIQGACSKCSGGKTCTTCGGSGKSRAKGFNGAELACTACRGSGNCPQCAGKGTNQQTCTACYGRGRALSKDRCAESYSRLLKPTVALPRPSASANGPAQKSKALEVGRQKNDDPAGSTFMTESETVRQRKPLEGDSLVSADPFEDKAAERKEELEKKRDKNAIDEVVRGAVMRCKDQVSRSELLKKYGLSKEDYARACSSDYTSVQRKKALQALWDRAKLNKDERMRGLFMPFPSGLKYTVEDVKQDKNGMYIVSLHLLERTYSQKTDKDALPPDCGAALNEALYPCSLLEYPTLLVPVDDKQIADLSKGQTIISGEWLIVWIICEDGRTHFDRFILRSDKEFNVL